MDSARREKPGSITLVRHGRPALARDQALNWREYEQWWAAYDAGGLASDQAPPKALIAAAKAADVIFVSTLRRARESAEAAAPGRSLIFDAIFVEAPLPPPRILGRFKPKPWGALARISWWMGNARGKETRAEAEARAERAAAILLERARAGESVILFAHGWFNRMLRPALVRQGWRCVFDGGDHFWSMRRFEPRQ